MTTKDLKILDDLLDRTETLPDVLHLRAAKIGYKLTEEDKAFLLDTYQKLDDILKEVAAFINIRFSGCERHVMAWNEIDFDTKIGELKVITNDREHINRAWNQGLFDLKNLIKTLKYEVALLIDESKENLFNTVRNENNFHGNIIYNESSNKGEQNMLNSSNKKTNEKRSWLEAISWIAAIIGAAIALYTFIN